MPIIYDTIEVDAEIDISVSDFFDKMSRSDKEEMSRLINGFGSIIIDKNLLNARGYSANEFSNSIRSLIHNYQLLSQYETDIINQIAKRF